MENRGQPDLNAKLTAAWQEISARIQARDRVLLYFITVSAALFGLALSQSKPKELVIGVGYVALGAALLLRHHDLIIGELARFKKALEHSDPPKDIRLIWTSECYIPRVYMARGLRDWAQALFVILGAMGTVYVAPEYLGSGPDPDLLVTLRGALFLGSLLSSVAAVCLIFATKRWRERTAKEEFRSKACDQVEGQRK